MSGHAASWGALALLLAAAAPDPAALRGFRAVGTRPSAAPAIRADAAASVPFALGASLAAWRNAAATVRYDAANTTGDGGDAEMLAEDCSDERIAFGALRDRLAAAKADLGDLAGRVGLTPATERAAWTARLAGAPKECR